MLKEYDVVRLKRAVKGIPAGTAGTIVHTFPQEPSVFWVEFPDAQIREEDGIIEVWEKDLEAERV